MELLILDCEGYSIAYTGTERDLNNAEYIAIQIEIILKPIIKLLLILNFSFEIREMQFED